MIGKHEVKKTVYLYSCFHLNLAFSSIEGRERQRVVDKCYAPLIELIESKKIPMGIEANASTLETIQELRPDLIVRLRELINSDLVGFVGSGLVQLIGPLVPAEVNRANLRLGNQIYEDLLGIRPRIALVNEQAYSPGLPPLYRDNGYDALIMDWASPYTHHPEWDETWKYAPQKLLGADGKAMDLIWNDTIPFQKFQRYVYGEMSIEDEIDYLASQAADTVRAFPFYASDGEIFDFRPSRYANETQPQTREWEKIGQLIDALHQDDLFQFVTPEYLLDNMENGGNILSLESPDDPVPVKKQSKYNLTRWAVSGRDDLNANTACWRMYQELAKMDEVTDIKWRSLCFKWRSDYRTHITQTRWNIYRWDMSDWLNRDNGPTPDSHRDNHLPLDDVAQIAKSSRLFSCRQKNHFLTVSGPTSELVLNMRRGMAIDAFHVPEVSEQSVFGTLRHGYFPDINWSADYYSGHLVAEAHARSKVCDLETVECDYLVDDERGVFEVTANIPTPLGDIKKTLTMYADRPRIDFSYKLSWHDVPAGNLRMGFVTLNPQAFDRETLYYQTHNGGTLWERHSLAENVDHSSAVSFLTSAKNCLGMTEGKLEIGDASKVLKISVDKDVAAMIGMIRCQSVADSYFCRVSLSAREIDDTFNNEGPFIDLPERSTFSCSIEVSKSHGD